MYKMRKIGPLLQKEAKMKRGKKVVQNMLWAKNNSQGQTLDRSESEQQNFESDFLKECLNSCFQSFTSKSPKSSFLLFSKFQNLSNLALAHLKKEDKIFFPLLEKKHVKTPYITNRDSRLQILRSDLENEHGDIQNMIYELLSLRQSLCSERAFFEKFMLFAEAMEHHVTGQQKLFEPHVLKNYSKNFVKGERNVYQN
jgi:hypothetical protein